MSIVTKAIVNGRRSSLLSPGARSIKNFVTLGPSLRIAQALTDNRSASSSWRPAVPKRPDIVSPGGNAYGQEMTATCLRTWITRLVTYGVVAGDVTPIEEIGVVGVRECTGPSEPD